jgi:hypothetical protein
MIMPLDKEYPADKQGLRLLLFYSYIRHSFSAYAVQR